MAAAVGWWESKRGSPRADLKQEPGSEVVCRGAAAEQQLELRGRVHSGEGAADVGWGRGQGG